MRPQRRSSGLPWLLIPAIAGLSCGPGQEAPTRPATSKPVAPAAAPEAKAAPPAAPTATLSTAEIVERCEPSVALIVGHDGSGTGFLVAPGLLATNSHVIEDENVENLEVRFPSAASGKRGPFKATLVSEDPGRDLAFLKVATDLPALEVARSYRFRKGEDVTIIGNPGIGPKQVLENAISRGVLSTRTSLDGQPFYQLNAAVNPGNSGGPVFDATGKVIGVVTLKASRGEQLTFCIPVEDLFQGIEKAKEALVAETGIEATGAGPLPALAYDWKAGQTYVYTVHLTFDDSKVAQQLDGSSIYTVRSSQADRIELAHRGWLTTRRRTRDGSAPTGGAVSMPSGATTTHFDVDRRGNLLGEAGKHPTPLLGDLATMIFIPLPDPLKRSWEVVRDLTLYPNGSGPSEPSALFGFGSRFSGHFSGRSTPGRGRMFPFGGFPTVEASIPVHETSKYVAGGAPDGTVIISRSSKQRIGAAGEDSVLTMSSAGHLTFDPKLGLPRAVEMRGRLSVGNARAPFRVTARLVEGAERDRALTFPVMSPTALQPITPEILDRHLAALRGPDDTPRRDAARALAEAEPIEARRGEVARALEKWLDETHDGVNRDVVTALGVWGDAASRPLLIARLNEEGYGARREAVDALARLGPDRAAADAIAACLGTTGLDAARALRALGASADPALRAIVIGEGPMATRVEACRLLVEVGTAASLPALTPLAARRDAAQLARQASETLVAIHARFPDDDEPGRLLNDLDSDQPKTRREAAARLAELTPLSSRRDEVVKALTPLLTDPDAEAQAAALRALHAWGAEALRALVLARIADPTFSPWREAVVLLTTRGPTDEALARAVADRIDADRAGVFEALKALGPAAEAPALTLLDHRDSSIRRGACGVLGTVGGTRALKPLEARAGDGSDPFLGGAARAALDAVKGRLAADESIRALLPRLRARDPIRRDDALRRVLAAPPSGALRGEVARALEDGLDPRGGSGQDELYKALATLGDRETTTKLIPLVTDRANHRWRQAVETLATLGLDDESLRALATRLPDDPSFLAIVFRKAGAGAEPFLRERLRDDPDPAARLDACRLLATLGTSESYPVLENLAGVPTELEPLAAAAADAVRAITGRP